MCNYLICLNLNSAVDNDWHGDAGCLKTARKPWQTSRTSVALGILPSDLQQGSLCSY